MADDCAFCRIVDGERSAHLVYEDDLTAAFLDRDPAVEGHALVVPKAHVEDVVTADERTAAAVSETVRRVSLALERVLEPDGFSVFHTTGPLVGRVTHAHVHVVPRFADDGIRLSLSRDAAAPDERLVTELREALES